MRRGVEQQRAPAISHRVHPAAAILAAVLGLSILASQALATPAFRSSGLVLRTGQEPVDSASGDLNEDGVADLVVANRTSQSLSLLLADGAGGFRPETEIAANTGVLAVRILDADSDGHLDLLVAGSFNLLFYRGHGTGEFDPVRSTYTGSEGLAFAAGDLDHDGWADAVWGDLGIGQLTIYWGGSGGVFQAGPPQDVAGRPLAFVLADTDTDGRLDVVSVSSDGSGSMSILFGNGDRTFRSRSDTAVPGQPSAALAADLDHDGDVDMVVTDHPPGSEHGVRVLRGDGHGHFNPEPAVSVGGYTIRLAAADFNGDGALDLAVTRQSNPPGVLVLLGSGSTFAAGPFLPTPIPAQAVVAGDFTGDGRADVAATRYSSAATLGTAVVWPGQGDGQFPLPPHFQLGGENRATVLADFNHDARPDVVIVHATAVEVRLGGPGGEFGPPATVMSGYGSRVVGQADLNADGNADLFVANNIGAQGHPTVSVLLGNGDGSFQVQREFRLTGYPTGALAADFNGDAKLDLAVAIRDGVISILPGRGDGTFGFKTDFPTLGGPYSLDTADLDADGALDLVAGANRSISVLRGRGDGSFSQPLDYFTHATYTRFVRLADLDADGAPDAVCAGTDGSAIVLRGAGDGSFLEPGVEYPLAGLGLDAVLADFDHDGALDVAVACASGVTVLAGDGAGGFTPAVQAIEDAHTIHAGDFDADGKLDLCVVTVDGEGTLLRNTTGDTPVWIEGFTVQRDAAGVRLQWHAHPGPTPVVVAIERATARPGPYAVVPNLSGSTCEWCEVLDSSAPGATELYYRLVLTSMSGQRAIAGPVAVDAATQGRTELGVPSWDALHRSATLRYAIGAPGAVASLSVLDVRGRVLWRSTRRFLAPGTYLESWDGRAVGGAVIPHGMYFVRLESGVRTWSRKLLRTGR